MTTKHALRKTKTTSTLVGLKAVGDPAAGVFEAYVSVFGNVDYHGDRIIPGAFADSLEEWKNSGDPIPVIFSHQWDDLDSHIGVVLEAEEHAPGDPRLAGTGLEENGGLWAKFALDVEEDFASRVAKRLDRRSLREFSFAYDVYDEARGTDGANELKSLGIIEVGPTLKGANPATRLLSAAGIDDDDERAIDRLEAVLFAGRKALEADGAKANVPVVFDGAVETVLVGVHEAATEWAQEGDIGNGGFYYLHLEATYPDDGRAVVCVEGWEDPIGAGIFYELNFATAEDGSIEISDPHEVEVEVSLSRKARDSRSGMHPPAGEKVRPTLSDKPDGGKSSVKSEDEEPSSRTEDGDEDGGDPIDVLLELAELE